MRKCCWKNGANRLALCRVATDLQSVKKEKKKQHLQSIIKRSTHTKRSVPVKIIEAS